jgi:hypothetical protein
MNIWTAASTEKQQLSDVGRTEHCDVDLVHCRQ